MIKLPYVLFFTAMTALFWGVYGVLLHQGQMRMHHSSLRAFVGVGIAYFLIAVLVPIGLLSQTKEKGYWSVTGTLLSLFAGSVGALGALGVILALAFNGSPIYVMPIVFGGAPVVNTLVTAWINKSFSQIKPLFIIGMALVGVGMVGVLLSKPKVVKAAVVEASTNTESKSEAGDEKKHADSEHIAKPASKEPNVLAIAASIVLAFVCWGAYGPVLHIGQMKMGGSRMRPFCCVGIAYMIIAVAAPLVILSASGDSGEFTTFGMFWSIIAGTAGALGALGIILAFNFGGKPIFVMPLVFGFAPVINAITSMTVDQVLSQISPFFIFSMAVGIAGAVTVLIFAPKAKPHGAEQTPAPKSVEPTAESSHQESTASG